MTNFLVAAILGIVQGLTEFLPVSSSGHLVLFESLFGDFPDFSGRFEVFVHAGTLLSIFVFFRKTLIADLFSKDSKYLKAIVVGSIPAAIVGFLLKSHIDALFSTVLLVGFGLLVSGLFNIAVSKTKPKTGAVDQRKAFFIGLFQALAIVPGISRSGSTIFAGTLKGIKRREAAKFSFLLSIPAVAGANLLLLTQESMEFFDVGIFLTGFVFSFFTGLFAIKTMLRVLENKHYYLFGYYCLLVGVVTIVSQVV